MLRDSTASNHLNTIKAMVIILRQCSAYNKKNPPTKNTVVRDCFLFIVMYYKSFLHEKDEAFLGVHA